MAWRQNHALSDEQWQSAMIICGQSDAGQISLETFYARLGQLTGNSANETLLELEGLLSLNEPLLNEIRQMRQVGIKIGLLSNSGASLRKTLQKCGIFELFDCIILSAEVGLVKPQSQIFELAAKQLNLPVSGLLFFDDRPNNVEGARLAGLTAEVFSDTVSCRQVLVEHCLLV